LGSLHQVDLRALVRDAEVVVVDDDDPAIARDGEPLELLWEPWDRAGQRGGDQPSVAAASRTYACRHD
jgi:hypothetical protein